MGGTIFYIRNIWTEELQNYILHKDFYFEKDYPANYVTNTVLRSDCYTHSDAHSKYCTLCVVF